MLKIICGILAILCFAKNANAVDNRVMLGISFSSGKADYYLAYQDRELEEFSYDARQLNYQTRGVKISNNELRKHLQYSDQLNYEGYRNVEGYKNTGRKQEENFKNSVLATGAIIVGALGLTVFAIASAF